ncbi:hypothetical protein GIB67_016817 [Kingdonia uniflora]|uniref:Uncharacterized protein n=1 Tax=Kingdonia uniflora TaxID=39325 RepID=A0A7J7LRS8_9MAGN|nr:hypothetical protein GIB67_016817 [Kingdonia uniflora]
MEEENITSTFKVRESEVVVLDPCAETSTVEQGAKVKLTFWLAQYLRSKEVVTIDMPPYFDKKTRKEVQPNVTCVDLRSCCHTFMSWDVRLCQCKFLSTLQPLIYCVIHLSSFLAIILPLGYLSNLE